MDKYAIVEVYKMLIDKNVQTYVKIKENSTDYVDKKANI